MKKTFLYTLMCIALFPLSTTIAAEVATADLTASATPIVLATEKPLTLSEKKTKADTELRALEGKFRIFTTRTQLTIDRLTTKGVDTSTAQTALSLSVAALNTAKTNLDALTKTIITDDMKEDAVERITIKTTLTTIQKSLKESRTYLIQSLTTLKTNVALTITQ